MRSIPGWRWKTVKHVPCEKPLRLEPCAGETPVRTGRTKGSVYYVLLPGFASCPRRRKCANCSPPEKLAMCDTYATDYGFIPFLAGSRQAQTLRRSGCGCADGYRDLQPWLCAYGVRCRTAALFILRARERTGHGRFQRRAAGVPRERSAAIVTSIGMDIPREAAILGTLGQIVPHDFQMAQALVCARTTVPRRSMPSPLT